LTEISAIDRYDAVFHLVTAADGAEEAYTLTNKQQEQRLSKKRFG
jgi:hypothetical protein